MRKRTRVVVNTFTAFSFITALVSNAADHDCQVEPFCDTIFICALGSSIAVRTMRQYAPSAAICCDPTADGLEASLTCLDWVGLAASLQPPHMVKKRLGHHQNDFAGALQRSHISGSLVTGRNQRPGNKG